MTYCTALHRTALMALEAAIKYQQRAITASCYCRALLMASMEAAACVVVLYYSSSTHTPSIAVHRQHHTSITRCWQTISQSASLPMMNWHYITLIILILNYCAASGSGANRRTVRGTVGERMAVQHQSARSDDDATSFISIGAFYSSRLLSSHLLSSPLR